MSKADSSSRRTPRSTSSQSARISWREITSGSACSSQSMKPCPSTARKPFTFQLKNFMVESLTVPSQGDPATDPYASASSPGAGRRSSPGAARSARRWAPSSWGITRRVPSSTAPRQVRCQRRTSSSPSSSRGCRPGQALRQARCAGAARRARKSGHRGVGEALFLEPEHRASSSPQRTTNPGLASSGGATR